MHVSSPQFFVFGGGIRRLHSFAKPEVVFNMLTVASSNPIAGGVSLSMDSSNPVPRAPACRF